jgi:crotonobetainyl-CoA:carnitine CoA-transferase CaiB-like acyl-CoA transferase
MPLSAYRVLELGTGSSLAYCGKVFADCGADVLKIEPPDGDPGRGEPPFVEVSPGCRESAYFAWLNTNKRSAAADLARVAALAGDADVLLDGRGPDEFRSGPLTHAALRAGNPALVIVAISPFGESGPYRDFITTDAVTRALAGLVSLIGPRERPVAINDHQADIIGGLTAFIAAMTGLMARREGGARFELSVHEANVTLSESQTAQGVNAPRARPGVNRFASTYPIGVFKCREGWIGVGISTTPQWRAFCEMFDIPHAFADPRLAVGPERARHADEIESLYAHRFLERTAAEWFAEALSRKIPFAIVPEMGELLRQPVHRDNGAFVKVKIGAATFEAPLMPLRLTRSPPRPGGTAPLADEIGDASWRERATVPAAPARGGTDRPLAGLRVVDFTMGWAGPLVSRHMADLGAEVVKIEACGHPDWWRGNDTRPAFFEQRMFEKRPNFLVLNRNKLGITLDLTAPEGVALAKRLVARADAVIENYSREVLPKLGLDYAALREVRPDLVMVSMAAFPPGPWAHARAYGFTLEQASGLPTVAGNPDGPPMISHYAYGDPVGGLNGTAALLIGLEHRRRTGEGQHIDLSQVECMLPMAAPWIIEQSVTGAVAPRMGMRHPCFVPQNCFRCTGPDDWVLVSVTDDAMWRRLCGVIGRADLAELGVQDRRARENDIERAVEQWTRERDADSAMKTLQQARVAAGVVRSPFDLAADPHLAVRSFWQPVDRPFCGPHVQPSLPFREGGDPYPVRHPAPTLGEFNEAVLGEILGLSRDELALLAAKGVIGTEALPPTPKGAKRTAVSPTGATA